MSPQSINSTQQEFLHNEIKKYLTNLSKDQRKLISKKIIKEHIKQIYKTTDFDYNVIKNTIWDLTKKINKEIAKKEKKKITIKKKTKSTTTIPNHPSQPEKKTSPKTEKTAHSSKTKTKKKTSPKTEKSAHPSKTKKKTKKIITKKNLYPKKWVLPNQKMFPSWIDKTFSNYKLTGQAKGSGCNKPNKDSSVQRDLFNYQKLVRDYINLKSPYRGLLLYHGLGSGKTCASIAIAEGFKHEKDIIVMLPASLHANFLGELKTCADDNWKLNQYWKFQKSDYKNPKSICNKIGANKIKIKKYNGCWINDTKLKPNYSDLSGSQKKEINDQLDFFINKKYKFLHYNGLRNANLDKMESNPTNPFNNKVVIIDEVHNLISRTTGGGTGRRLYDLLMNAKNLKLILLSGTPLINYPYEAGLLINLLRGNIQNYQLNYSSKRRIENLEEKILSILQQNKHIDQINVNPKSKIINFTKNPHLFTNDDPGFKIKTNQQIPQQKFISEIINSLKPLNIEITARKIQNFKALPDNEKEFNQRFIDLNTNRVKNSDLFIKRILGTISYYKGARKDLFPSSTGIQLVEVPMSDYQFLKYSEIRMIERKAERKSKTTKTKKDENNVSSYYRIFSRSYGNFVFPEKIERPMPGKDQKLGFDEKTLENFDSEMEDFIEENDDVKMKKSKKEKNKIYEEGKLLAMQKLNEEKDLYLKPGPNGLDKYSPKFLYMLQNIQKSPGSVFIYSQFRSLEGIGIFSLVLEANGYAPFRLRKNNDDMWEAYEEESEETKPKFAFYSGTEDDEYKDIIKSIFNNDENKVNPGLKEYMKSKGGNLKGNIIKILLATSSAAEGISLANVRQVHITEPYWNPVRIEQVMGRAIRICSHSNLPLKDRNVEVFLYVSSFTKEQIKSDFTIENKDKGMTSGQTIYEIAKRKQDITNDLFRLMKESAIDCSLNSKENEPIKCFNFGLNPKPNQYSTVPNINDEWIDSYSQMKTIEHKGKLFKVGKPPNEKKYVLANENKVYDYESWQNAAKNGARVQEVGKLINGKLVLNP